MNVWNHWDLGVILSAVEVYVLLLVSYLLWKSCKDKYKVCFKCKRYTSFQKLLSRICSTLLNTAGEKRLFYAQHWLVSGRPLFIPYFSLINLLIKEWRISETTVYIPISMCSFSISGPQTTGMTCFLVRASTLWEGVKGIQSRLSGQLYFFYIWVLQGKIVGKRIFQDPKSYQLLTLHLFLASLSTF